MPTQTPNVVAESLKRHLSGWWLAYIALLANLYLFYKIAGPLLDLLTNWLLSHEVDLKGTINIDGYASGVLVGGVFLLFALIVFSIYTGSKLVTALRLADSALQVPILTKTFERTVQAADRIARQLFPGSATATKRVVRCKQVYTLYKNGDCQGTETIVVTAHGSDIHFMEKLIAAEDLGDPADFPDDIDLKVVSLTQYRDVAYLISGNEKRRKNVMVFFLPRIQATVPEEREVRITFFWKGFFKRLVTLGEEPFEIGIKTVASIPIVEYEFWVAPDAGKLICQNVGQMIDEHNPEREKLVQMETADEKGMTGWRYTATEYPMGHKTRLRLTWKKS